MNTQNPLRHRHFFGIPVFVALFLGVASLDAFRFSMHAALASLQGAQELTARGADLPFSFTDGAYGLLSEDGMLRDDGTSLSLEDGTVLAASQGKLDLRAGSSVLSGFHGGFLATRTADTLSVLALTTPVLLTDGDVQFIIPEGMQGSFAADALPPSFILSSVAQLRDHLTGITPELEQQEVQMLSSLPPAALPPFPSAATPSATLDFLTLPAAQDRLAESQNDALLAQLRSAIAAHDASVNDLLQRPQTQQMLLSPDLPSDALSTLLAEAGGAQSTAAALLPYVRDPALWLLLSFHPGYRLAAWNDSGPLGMSLTARQLRWLELPSSDVADAIPALVVDEWQREVSTYLATERTPKDFLEPLLQTMASYKAFAQQSDYPERLDRYSRAIAALTQHYASSLSPTAQATLQDWASIDAIAPYSEAAAVVIPPPAETTSSSSISSIAPFDASAVEAQTKQMLLAAGGLFTIQTALHATSAGEVTVTGLVYADALGDHVYDFTLDTASREAHDIRRDGASLPYALTLDALAQWARGK